MGYTSMRVFSTKLPPFQVHKVNVSLVMKSCNVLFDQKTISLDDLAEEIEDNGFTVLAKEM